MMRAVIGVLTAVGLLVPLHAQECAEWNLQGVSLGDSQRDVREKLGKPLFSGSNPFDKTHAFNYQPVVGQTLDIDFSSGKNKQDRLAYEVQLTINLDRLSLEHILSAVDGRLGPPTVAGDELVHGVVHRVWFDEDCYVAVIGVYSTMATVLNRRAYGDFYVLKLVSGGMLEEMKLQRQEAADSIIQ